MTTKTKKSKSTKAAPRKAPSAGSGGKLRKAAIAEIGERIAKLDGAPTAGDKARKAKPATAKRTSAIEAALQVLSSTNDGMTSKDLIDEMAKRGLWTSPGGKTPHATLYAAIVREISRKGNAARFRKTDRGHFAFNDRQAA